MDQFEVPHNVNQHVFKALFILQPTNAGFVSTNDITKQVKMQMRDCNDAPQSDGIIRESLSNLTKMGILACTGSMDYALEYTIKLNADHINVVPKTEPKKKSKTQAKQLMVGNLLICILLISIKRLRLCIADTRTSPNECYP